MAYAFAVSASYGCFYFRVEAENGLSQDLGLLSFSNSVQFWYDGTYECIAYSSSQSFDSAFTAARAFGIMGNIFTGIPMIYAIVMACMSMPKIVNTVMTFMMFFGSLCEILTFVAFAADVCTNAASCTFNVGAGLAIGGCIAAFCAGVCFSKVKPAAPEENFVPGAAQPAGTVTVTETVEPDGTKKTIKTTVNADGSKTVEETIERPGGV